MGKILHTIGKTSFERAWWVIGGWIVVLVTLGLLAGHFYKQPSDAISIPGTEAQASLERLGELFPDAGKGTGRIVFETPDGDIREHRAAIVGAADKLRQVEGVQQVVDPFMLDSMISKDGRVAYATVSLTQDSTSVDKKTIGDIEEVVSATRTDALSVEMGGDVISNVPGEILGVGEIIGVIIALVVLVITLGSLVAAGLPIVVAVATVIGGAAGLFALSNVVDITSTTPVLAIMLGLAVGIDYSLFIVNKYRHYLMQGYGYRDSAAKAVATAGNAVVFAAVTVVIALSALAVVGIPFMTNMGLAAAATVGLAALVSITLLPALFGIVGARIFRGATRKSIEIAQHKGPHESHTVSHATIWYKIAQRIAKHPIITLVVTVLVVAVIALPMKSLTLGLPSDEYAAVDTTQRKAYDALKRGFGEGFNSPLIVVAENVPAVTDADRQTVRAQVMAVFDRQVASETKKQTAQFEEQMAAAQTDAQRLEVGRQLQQAQVLGAQKIAQERAKLDQQMPTYERLYQLNKIADEISARSDVDTAMPLLAVDDTTKGVIQVIPKQGPSDASTKQLIHDLRDSTTVEHLAGNAVTTFGVTGSTALQLDIDAKLAQALPQYLFVVVGLSFVLLVLVFRSILVPVKATLGFLLSVAAMFGAMVVAFQWGWFGVAEAPGPIVSFIPIISIGVLFGLAMDYEFFLVSSIHEEYGRTGDAKRAVVNGYAIGSKVVVSAAVIMVAVFAGFVSNHDATIQTIGFGLAVGIFVDAFIVRLLIVPAVMALLGKSAWWLPKWLDRIVPNLSIEGEDVSPASRKA